MVRVQILGYGNAFASELGNSSFYVYNSKHHILVDCGSTVFGELKRRNIIDKIDTVFITHCHGDHIGSLDTFLYYKRFILNQRVRLLGCKSVKNYLNAIDPRILKEDYKKYFLNKPIKNLIMIPVEHSNMEAVAFYYEKVLISGDTGKSLLNTKYALNATHIYHEFTHNEIERGIHTPISDLEKAPQFIKDKTILYHYKIKEKNNKFNYAEDFLDKY